MTIKLKASGKQIGGLFNILKFTVPYVEAFITVYFNDSSISNGKDSRTLFDEIMVHPCKANLFNYFKLPC